MQPKLYSIIRLFITCVALLSLSPLSAQFNPCNFDAGTLSVADGGRILRICIDDPEEPVDINQDGFIGGMNRWFITSTGGIILDANPGIPPFDLSSYGARAVAIWSVAFSGDLDGVELGENICNAGASECFDLSNSVVVDRNTGDDCDQPCDVTSGELSLTDGGGVSTTICIDDGPASAVAVSLSGPVSGENTTFLITNEQAEILAIPGGDGPFDISGAGTGTCIIWHLAFDDGLEGLAVGNTPSDFDGCFAISNGVAVERVTGDDCPMAFTATINGVNEVPVPVTSTGVGNLVASIAGNTLMVSGSFSGLTADFDATIAGGAHLHNGLAGQAGGIAVILTTQVDDDLRGGVFIASQNTFELTDEQADALRARGIYINIHSTEYPAGEIRGQLVPAGADAYNRAFLLGVNEVPSIVTSAQGGVIIERTGNEITVSGGFSGLSSAIATSLAGGAHIHVGAVGQNGPVLVPLNMDISDDMTAASFPADDNTFTLTDEQVATMNANGLYVNVHSMNFLGGELRGQITDESTISFYADLSGHQEQPEPVNTMGAGRVQANVTGSTMTVFGSVANLSDTILTALAGGAHLHLGLAGESGPVTFPLTIDLNETGNGGVWSATANTFELDEDQLETLFARGYYVNVHSAAVGSGEVRGQVMNLAKGYFGANLSGANAKPFAVETTGTGFLMSELAGTELTVTGAFSDLVSDFDANVAGGSHLHVGNSAMTGGVDFVLAVELSEDLRSGVYQASENTFTLSDAQSARLQSGGYYFNLHTVNNPSGEIRGQLLRDDNAFPSAPVVDTPAEGAEITIFSGSSDLTGGTFAAATDPNDDALVYLVEFVALEGTDDEVRRLYTIGPDTTVDRSFDAIYDTLVSLGAINGLTIELEYRVLASDGSVETPGTFRTVSLTLSDGQPCLVDGGVLALADGGGDVITICAGDGVSDAFNVTLTDTVGSNFTYVITNDSLEILGLPADQPFDLEDAGGGICLVWALSFEDGLEGATVGANAGDLSGCFDLSNPITVIRQTGDDCATTLCMVDGGLLSLSDGGDSITICAGDGNPDPFDVILTDTVGSNFTYVITNDSLEILGLPADQPFDLEGAGGGLCLIWALSFEDGLEGAMVGANAGDLSGCFDLSNPIYVTRLTGDDCMDGLTTGVVINEVSARGQIELTHLGGPTMDLRNLTLRNATGVIAWPASSLTCGNFQMKPGEITVIDFGSTINPASGELALASTEGLLQSYVAWGTGDRTLETAAISAMVWSADNVLGPITDEASLQLLHDVSFPTFRATEPTICSENELSVSTSFPTAAASVLAFPNPFSRQLTLEVDGLKADRSNLEVLDLNGRLLRSSILEFRTGRIVVPMDGLSQGTYLLRVTNTNGVSTLRVVRQ